MAATAVESAAIRENIICFPEHSSTVIIAPTEGDYATFSQEAVKLKLLEWQFRHARYQVLLVSTTDDF